MKLVSILIGSIERTFTASPAHVIVKKAIESANQTANEAERDAMAAHKTAHAVLTKPQKTSGVSLREDILKAWAMKWLNNLELSKDPEQVDPNPISAFWGDENELGVELIALLRVVEERIDANDLELARIRDAALLYLAAIADKARNDLGQLTAEAKPLIERITFWHASAESQLDDVLAVAKARIEAAAQSDLREKVKAKLTKDITKRARQFTKEYREGYEEGQASQKASHDFRDAILGPSPTLERYGELLPDDLKLVQTELLKGTLTAFVEPEGIYFAPVQSADSALPQLRRWYPTTKIEPKTDSIAADAAEESHEFGSSLFLDWAATPSYTKHYHQKKHREVELKLSTAMDDADRDLTMRDFRDEVLEIKRSKVGSSIRQKGRMQGAYMSLAEIGQGWTLTKRWLEQATDKREIDLIWYDDGLLAIHIRDLQGMPVAHIAMLIAESARNVLHVPYDRRVPLIDLAADHRITVPPTFLRPVELCEVRTPTGRRSTAKTLQGLMRHLRNPEAVDLQQTVRFHGPLQSRTAQMSPLAALGQRYPMVIEDGLSLLVDDVRPQRGAAA
ncbi:hypothetical protein [Roseobacter sp. OBYS 0001]|uniref:hypothetical protein n=1 Tax=Roseobacter sp. OBYS 0001 TaxID=882651 RepID=UPI001BBEC796|nr:hypothetical protein [Roseobacter sp. OBYS 0001]GIT88882.1 hypothetical protein ROBYS_38980 [Roseobacter sp. OBYS 0001]